MIPAAPTPGTRWRPWTGLLVAPLAWLALQQGLGVVVYHACARGGPPWGLAAGAAATLICLAAARRSWRARRLSRQAGFIGPLAAGLAAALALASLLIGLSASLVPACAR